MPIRRKTPPVLIPSNLDEVVNELNRLFTEIYNDINIMNNKLALYLNMVQDKESGEEGSIRLNRKVTSNKADLKYELIGTATEGWVSILGTDEGEGLDLLDKSESQTAMEVKTKSIDTDKPRYSKRTLK